MRAMTAALFAGGTVVVAGCAVGEGCVVAGGWAVAEGWAVVAGAVAVAAVPLPAAGTACVDCGAMAEGSRTSFALVQAASVSAASNDTVVACDRLICLKTPWR
ncbi:Cytochrome c family protein [Mesorhizobium escarrei]|uniref:Cytochrome c family protein n=1 Tax=Mesorhizobium escarrei TaxID=666018 RepID=A0ABM9EFH0_9HYPH|nr:Cytochrome c family protein [Mesorhizobium escarrei]